ncbi:hypothetical protein INS49_009095 [Diaporthe citri]|uniref:uncharacterized protein n=1 Tax=Diaporthe citri TaxID=83186 RepID=UPI001C80603C|nr:uncharacterized protein INS49_009095 [Diaporthe citri]KAG6363992.1 hypothetical protein INS49_009095 [Diaporthe citri]
MTSFIWTLFITLAAASPALLPSRQSSADYGTVNFFWDEDCTQSAGTKFPENNVVQPGPAGVASMQWVQVTCTSALCTTNPTLFACADANCDQAGTVRVGQCATYSSGVWAFWQRESATGVGTGTGTGGTGTRPPPAPVPAPVNPFPFPLPPTDDTDGQDDGADGTEDGD